MGDISRFDDVKEIQKISGLGLVACSSGKHKGENQDQSQRTQEAEVLAVPGREVGGCTFGSLQKPACALYYESREPVKEDAVAYRDSMQPAKGDIHASTDRPEI